MISNSIPPYRDNANCCLHGAPVDKWWKRDNPLYRVLFIMSFFVPYVIIASHFVTVHDKVGACGLYGLIQWATAGFIWLVTVGERYVSKINRSVQYNMFSSLDEGGSPRLAFVTTSLWPISLPVWFGYWLAKSVLPAMFNALKALFTWIMCGKFKTS